MWIAAQFMERSDALYEWSAQLFAAIQDAQNHGALTDALQPYIEALNDTVTACQTLGVDPSDVVAPQVLAWSLERRRTF